MNDMTCVVCGKSFPADPDCIIETFLSAIHVTEDEVAMAGYGKFNTVEFEKDPDDMTDEDLMKYGLIKEDLDKMSNGEIVSTGSECICHECQDGGEELENWQKV